MRNILLFILGREVDSPITRWEEQFLPEVFGKDLDRITVQPENRPLVAHKEVLYSNPGPGQGERTSESEVWVAVLIPALLIFGFGAHLLLHKKLEVDRKSGAHRPVSLGCIGELGWLVLVLFWSATAYLDCHKMKICWFFASFISRSQGRDLC